MRLDKNYQHTNAMSNTPITIKEVKGMDLNLRKAVLANVTGNSQDELENTILEAIKSGEEKMLPGLGVLFEVIWQNSTEEEKTELLDTLSEGLQ
jgi:small acid-soluble spore protein I (minor)